MRGLSKTLAGAGLALAMAFGMPVERAEAAPITITFTGINYEVLFAESGFTFTVTGSHSDGDNYMSFHDGGANPGNTDLIITFGGALFSLVSFELMDAYDDASFLGSDGSTFAVAAGTAPGVVQVGMTNVTSIVLSVAADGGINFDNLVVDTSPRGAPTAVPEPGTLALLGAGLVGLAGATRRRRRVA